MFFFKIADAVYIGMNRYSIMQTEKHVRFCCDNFIKTFKNPYIYGQFAWLQIASPNTSLHDFCLGCGKLLDLHALCI